MLPLTTNGQLSPGRHVCRSTDLFDYFVTPFPNTNRHDLFAGWELYTHRLKVLVGEEPLIQWLDGSFLSDKPNPGDIDLVTYVPFETYEARLEQLIDHYSTFSLHDRGLDAYICPVYPVGHAQYNVYKMRQAYWHNLFGQSKRTIEKKGYVELLL